MRLILVTKLKILSILDKICFYKAQLWQVTERYTFQLFNYMAVFACIQLSKGQVCWNSLGKY